MDIELSSKANNINSQISQNTKLGDLRKIDREIKKDHDLAMELWSTAKFLSRQLAILIMDKKLLTQELIDKLDSDIQEHEFEEGNQLIDWLTANQLSKDKKMVSIIASWQNSTSKLQRRVFWYYQARLRWTGNTNHPNTKDLLTTVESNMANEEPEVQWAMNFTVCQIGVWDEKYRKQCIAIGEKIRLYKDEPVPKNCTPDYIPDFIPIEVAKLNKK
ncbi:DNA alkylation repair protein [Marivirga harenae]|uniref:DNA alkylation repair protein n=1 Tax=Marivirga harenae TaxID=2010992 RepID=UPI0026DFFDC3|nr:DNA alkylation repair protein [Marivirga harenae]WKV13352.1 DNA alkylation repair protein [Marivirga harenae]|tara:strand:+ start:177599 stop:178249 length:651 start_codon:yes stop_codon:yes gene_type:complete